MHSLAMVSSFAHAGQSPADGKTVNMTNTHDDPGNVTWYLDGYRQEDQRLQAHGEIPVRLWPLMGSIIGRDFGDGMVARSWKSEWLDAADQLDMIGQRLEQDGRVTALLAGYLRVTWMLLHADVNGGLDEEYEDFPEAPVVNRTC